MIRLTAVAGESDRNRKIKYYIRSNMGVSYRQFSDLKASGGMHVNGQTVHANYLLVPGDLIEVFLEDSPRASVEPEEIPIDVVYEDDDLIILNKPAPLACQCSPKQPNHTLENRMAARYGDEFVFHPINRLDRGTSGLMTVAKHAHACQLLQRQLHTSAFVREYLAVVEGRMEEEGTISLPISKENAATVRRVVDFDHGKPAVTHYKALDYGNGRTLVRLRLETGRTHQIRVHLSYLAHPIAGDFLYGTELDALPNRFALHSAHIELDQPITGGRIKLDSPLPAELEGLYHSL